MRVDPISKNPKIKGLDEKTLHQLLPQNLILLGYRGSIAHGTYVSPKEPHSLDDKDIMGVYVAPIEHYFGFEKFEVHEKFMGEWDAVHYEIRKFVSLLLKSNPNVISLLWLDPKFYLKRTKIGNLLIQNRDIFISKKAFHSFSGYADSQLRRMTRYQHEGYMGEKRKRLVEKFGYDCKNASHLIRLLEMCIEFLNEGKLYVERPNASKLVAIKNGEWSLEKIKEEAERLMNLSQEAYIRSPLPPEPDYEKAQALTIQIICECFNFHPAG
ncbi:MAG: nucleotidyltransferase domain-containing protein [Chlamydiae bacterium]|nr:nucleotidyltransferase domain-containing protein [Chlamydiota bacterium]